MKRITVILIALFAVLYAMADVYSDMLNAGIKAYNSGNYKKALTFFNKANEQAPTGRAASWISKCKKAIKDHNEELERLKRENEARRRQQEQQAEAERRRQEEERQRQEEERKKREQTSWNYSTNTLKVNGVAYKMVYVIGGTFPMGSYDGESNEKPVHYVTLSSYYIGKTEVTQALWKAVMGSNPSYFKGDNLPVEEVNWDDCVEFITTLNQLTGEHFRLPTEAEWEFAARGGNQRKGNTYSGSSIEGDVAWYDSNSGNKTHPVAIKSLNELGIYDMSGNVWEWCQDRYGGYSSNAQANPTGPTSGSSRVNRGGSWDDGATYCRSANRNSYTPAYRSSNLGLRLAR